jgi:hypothetical protein
MFLAAVTKAQVELKHLKHSRRTALRMRSELMAALYDKALKRKDFSGITQDRTTGSADPPAKSKKGAERQGKNGEDVKKLVVEVGGNTKIDDKQSHKKAGADIGKIIQLMAGDTNRIAESVSRPDYLYVHPFLTMPNFFLF